MLFNKLLVPVGCLFLWIILTQKAEAAGCFGYNGQRYDSASGTTFLRARYYDAEIGSFLTKDSLGVVANVNMYSYAGADPVDKDDPTGQNTYGVGIQGSGTVLLGEQLSLVTTISINDPNRGQLMVLAY